MIPTILIHKGHQSYLDFTIKQAAKTNLVYLIGDTNPNINLHNFKFFNFNDLLEGFNEFKQQYIHLNTTPIDYEIFCYQRWFILKNFMEKQKLDVVFYIDSDVLLFSNPNDEWYKFNQFDITLLHRTAAISSFITFKGLERFCNMLITIYSNKDTYAFKKIESHYKIRRDCGLSGGVCDMTLFEYFHYNSEFGGGPGRVGEMMTIIDNSTYDHNINAEDQDFSYKNGIKEVIILNKQPFVFSKKLDKQIKFNSLHFQGGAKQLIPFIYEKCN